MLIIPKADVNGPTVVAPVAKVKVPCPANIAAAMPALPCAARSVSPPIIPLNAALSSAALVPPTPAVQTILLTVSTSPAARLLKPTVVRVVTPVTPSATLATTGVPGARPAITGAARSVCAPIAVLVKVTKLPLTTAPLLYAPTVPLMVPPLTAAAANTVPVVRFANALAT